MGSPDPAHRSEGTSHTRLSQLRFLRNYLCSSSRTGLGGGGKLFIDTHSSLFKLQGLQDWDPSVAGIRDSQGKRRHFDLLLRGRVELLPKMHKAPGLIPSTP